MAKTREIKGRMKAVGNIQRITKTMQMIATARFQAMQRKATAAQAYADKLGEVVGELAAALQGEGDVSSPLLAPSSVSPSRELVLTITSNRGLCGGYNAGVLRTAMAEMRQTTRNIDLEVVGKKGSGYFKFAGRPVTHFHTQIADSPEYDQVEPLAQRYMDDFNAGKYDAIKVVYTSFVSMSKQQPRVMQLLPLERVQGTEGPRGQVTEGGQKHSAPGPHGPSAPSTVYEFSPDEATLLRDLLPMSVKTRLYQAFNEAVVSEQLARMVAMKAATDAAGKMKTSLKRQFNRARQTAITTELSEIISGAAALE